MIEFDCTLARPAFSFDVAFRSDAGVTALFGPSGSGKSTTIRLLAGLDKPDRGYIRAGEALLLDTAHKVWSPKHRRRIGMVFQDAQLLPHLNVRTNLTYGRWFTPEDERRIEFDAVVDVLGIGHLLTRRPMTLSGGERQRVAIGRALLTTPRLLLMDEPLASLDAARKLEIMPFIERLRDEFRIPIVYVSHAVDEVARLASFVVRLDRGRVVAVGPTVDVLAAAPAGGEADRFDVLSILSGTIDRYVAEHAVTVIAHPAGEMVVPGRVGAPGDRAVVQVRATNVALATGAIGTMSIRTVLRGRIAELRSDVGPFVLATIVLSGGARLSAYLTRLAVADMQLAIGSQVQALVKSVSIEERGIGRRHDAKPESA
jgi:molybdate transport system ATP-binding protein